LNDDTPEELLFTVSELIICVILSVTACFTCVGRAANACSWTVKPLKTVRIAFATSSIVEFSFNGEENRIDGGLIGGLLALFGAPGQGLIFALLLRRKA
jgi:hypothetical protein